MRLSKPQKLIYDMEKFIGGSVAVICGSMLLPSKRDVTDLQQAVNSLYRLNDALRIRIVESGGEVSQVVDDYIPREIEILRFESKAELDTYAQKYAKDPLDFYGSLAEFKIVTLPESCGILVKLHHIIGDAWTLSLIGNQFNVLLNGETPEAYSYTNYLDSEDTYQQSKRFTKDKSFFLEQFKKCDEATYLSEKSSDSYNAERKTFVISAEQARIISDYAQKKEASIFTLFTSALAVYFNRVKMNAEKFYIGTAVLNRGTAKEKNTMGMFINTVPMLIELDNKKSFADNLSAIEDVTLAVLRHQKFNYGDVLADLRKEYSFTEKLYDVIISYQNATVVECGCETTWYPCGAQTESLQIHIDDRDNEGIFRVHYDYLTDKFSGHEIDMLHQHIEKLLFAAVDDDSKRMYELDILTQWEKDLLLAVNDTAADYPRDKCIHQLFEEQVEKTPDKVAVIACDKTLTYAELNEQANRIANGLIEQGVKPGDIVAFMLPRESYLIAAMFGILKSGAAYLPIDPDYPQDRIDYMLIDSHAKYCVTEENIGELLNHSSSCNPTVSFANDCICYCIYTSGSTGKPKGTLLTHRNVVNYVHNNNNNVIHRIIKDDFRNIVSVTTVGFDIFVTESLMPLTNGLTVVFANENQARLQLELNDLIEKYSVDVMQTTPTKMNSLIADLSKVDYLRKLKAIILGGEALDGVLVDKLQKLTNAEIYNIYGPTEATVWVSNAQIINSKDITIGKPIANTQIYIVNKYMQIVPIGVIGELCIAGDCVGAGYLNRPKLTAEKFIDNPFGDGKLYKTGDLAYWREDGNIVYVGRNDFQVKIRGLRIELGEIENAVSSVDGIAQAVVIVRKNIESRQLICAFYTGKEVDAKEIRSQIGGKLPKYMLPHIITHIDAMPLTSSGKVNRKALPEVDLNNLESTNEFVPPVTEREKAVAKILSEILGIERVGLADDFFADLGCDSLKAIEFISVCHTEGIYFNLQAVFDHPTISELLQSVDQADQTVPEYDCADFAEIHQRIANNCVDQIQPASETPVGNILLTGATGYLGIHILADYLEHDTGTAYCIVRGKDIEGSKQRLNEYLRFYFGDKYIGNDRIRIFCGDLTKDRFGLSDEDYQYLIENTDTVINSVASVKHYGSYQFFYETNVESVLRQIEFCKASKAKLIHISTTSVAGNDFDNQVAFNGNMDERDFTEHDLFIGQPLDNVYVRSKFEAEKAVFEAMTGGLQANIMRMGNLTNRRSDGKFQRIYKSNAFLNRIKAIVEIGCIPDYLLDLYSEFTPIDDAANAVMTIARHFRNDKNVFHVENTNVLGFRKMLKHLHVLGIPMDVVNGDEFSERLKTTEADPKTKHIFETFINDLDMDSRLQYDSPIKIDTAFTKEYLRSLGFAWHETDLEYLRKYFEYFKGIGYIGGNDN